jgi:hypothetical protein
MILQHQTDGYFDHAAENLHKRGRQDAGRKEGVSGANIAIEFILRRNMNSSGSEMFRHLLILTSMARVFTGTEEAHMRPAGVQPSPAGEPLSPVWTQHLHPA